MLFPQHSAAKTRAVTSATQPHLFRPLQITHAQYRHEDAMLLKQVSSTSDHSGKNDVGVTWITLYFHNKHERCSLICQPHRSLQSNICILPAQFERVILQVIMSLQQCWPEQTPHFLTHHNRYSNVRGHFHHVIHTDDTKSPIINANIILIQPV
jgi:hypothetical protein